MKILEVNHLQTGIDHAIKEIESFYGQISAVQRAVRDFHSLDDALKGKGGEAIRAFYNECHQPFLIYLYQSLVDYQSVLTGMKDAVDSFESNKSGFVSQEFLENDVVNEFDKVKKKTIELTDDANSILEGVQDLVAVKKIDESEVVESVQRGKNKAKDVVEELNALDASQVIALESVKDDLNTMRNYISDIESKFKSGDLSVRNYSVEALQGISAYNSIMDEVYGEGSGSFEVLLKKMGNGETLTDIERNELYDYLQNVMLDDKKRNEIVEIAGFINEKDIDKLQERLNDEVVLSMDALEEEMAMVQAYVFLGTNNPSRTDVDYDIRSKLEAYLMLLKNYHSSMENDNVILVGKIEYEKNHNDIPGHFLESVIQTATYNVDEKVMSKEKFRDFVFFNPDGFLMLKNEFSEVTYATGASASNNIEESELKGLQKEYANYEANFIVTKVVNKVISELANKINISGYVDVLNTAVGFDSEKKELGGKIEIGNALTTASKLDLEISISEGRPGRELNLQLYPLDGTFEKIDRWKELHEINPDIPFPEESVNSHDWYEIGQKLRSLELDLDSKITDYISNGALNGEESVKALVNGIE